MRFKNLDLNLLFALDTLLRLRSVSEAARALSLSQPAISAALARLREYFDDDLLVLYKRRMVPTAFAQSLAPLIEEVLGKVDVLISTSATFDAESSKRVFHVSASDYVSLVVIAPLLKQLAQTAPGVRLEITAPSDEIVTRLGQGEIDLLVSPEEFLQEEHPTRLLFEEDHVLVAWEDHPIFGAPITEESFFAFGHVAVEIGPQRTRSFGERQLARFAPQRRVEIIAPSFAVVPWMLPNTLRLAVMHQRLADTMLPALPIRSAPLPIKLPKMREMIQHHASRSSDAAVMWLAEQMVLVASEHIKPARRPSATSRRKRTSIIHVD